MRGSSCHCGASPSGSVLVPFSNKNEAVRGQKNNMLRGHFYYYMLSIICLSKNKMCRKSRLVLVLLELRAVLTPLVPCLYLHCIQIRCVVPNLTTVGKKRSCCPSYIQSIVCRRTEETYLYGLSWSHCHGAGGGDVAWG